MSSLVSFIYYLRIFFFSFILQKSFIDSPANPHPISISQVLNTLIFSGQLVDNVSVTEMYSNMQHAFFCAGSFWEDPEGRKDPPWCHPLQGASHDQRQEVPPEDVQVSHYATVTCTNSRRRI